MSFAKKKLNVNPPKMHKRVLFLYFRNSFMPPLFVALTIKKRKDFSDRFLGAQSEVNDCRKSHEKIARRAQRYINKISSLWRERVTSVAKNFFD